VDWAGVPTAVVTPSGDSSNAPGAAVRFSKVGDVVGVVTAVDDGPDDVAVDPARSDPDEQPASRVAAAAAAKNG
jgi:hypothetical protein